jgi:hypothetical protein
MIAACVLAAACGNGKGGGTTPAGKAVTLPEPTGDVYEISQRGVGPIVDFRGVEADDQASIAALQELLGGSGLEVSFEVMDIGTDEVEAEEGYYSIRKGEEEIAQVMRTEPFMTVHALSPLYATRDRISPGSKLPALAAARPSVACTASATEGLGAVICRTAEEPDVVFVMTAACHGGELPRTATPVAVAKLGDCEIVEIVR